LVRRLLADDYKVFEVKVPELLTESKLVQLYPMFFGGN